jgi:mRNA interferase MazF
MQWGEVWWVDFDSARSGEIRKKLPAAIVSNDLSNVHLNRLQLVPVVSNTSRLFPSETFATVGGHFNKPITDQFTTVAKEPLGVQLGALTRPDLKSVEHFHKIQLGLML